MAVNIFFSPGWRDMLSIKATGKFTKSTHMLLFTRFQIKRFIKQGSFVGKDYSETARSSNVIVPFSASI